MRRRCRQPRGLVILDALIGLVLLSAMLAALVTALTQHRKLSETLSDQRAAVRALEAAAIDWRAGRLRFEQDGEKPPVHSELPPDAGVTDFGVLAQEHDDGWIELWTATRSGRQSLFVKRAADATEVLP
ncbi:MAG: hypothetical protein AAF328_02320 [Planctomycetota bacterium]